VQILRRLVTGDDSCEYLPDEYLPDQQSRLEYLLVAQLTAPNTRIG
jgi:hypothetical protein